MEQRIERVIHSEITEPTRKLDLSLEFRERALRDGEKLEEFSRRMTRRALRDI